MKDIETSKAMTLLEVSLDVFDSHLRKIHLGDETNISIDCLGKDAVFTCIGLHAAEHLLLGDDGTCHHHNGLLIPSNLKQELIERLNILSTEIVEDITDTKE